MATASQTIGSTEELELTERELAIAAGADPDRIEQVETPPIAPNEQAEVAAGIAPTATAPAETEEAKIGATSGSKDAAPVTPVSGAHDANHDWINQEAKDYAASYGLTEDELKSYGSLSELRRAGAIFDKHLTKKPEAALPLGQQPVIPAPVVPAKPVDEYVPHDLEALKTAGYDDLTLKMAADQNKAYEQLKQANERAERAEKSAGESQKYYQQEEAKRQAQVFHQSVDTLEESRFGRTSDKNGRPLQVTPIHDVNRQKLHQAALLIVDGISAQATRSGQQAQYPTLPVLLQRAEALAFADEIREGERAKVKAEVAAQTKKRRPVGNHKPTQPTIKTEKPKPETTDDIVSKAMANKELEKFFNEAQETNGAR